MRFCQSFMTELQKHTCPSDVPAGDIGVGDRNRILFGSIQRLRQFDAGVLTGKPLVRGSLIRPEATGYGLAYYTSWKRSRQTATALLVRKSRGSGNVAQYALQKLNPNLVQPVISVSDSNGYVIDENGIDFDLLTDVKENVVHVWLNTLLETNCYLLRRFYDLCW